ncbi:ankyrin repeat-containing domain protein [Massariosphaeria phaeospora]|uniref:Ankyrin repeat-containing domain protein n=1 Tax=Massariosphaeria phaeospora TaxID=100035 RepID=A0A7C8M9J5_9PLEO|nr:ankyrin repeat-containing domain protein [Massariosphaeria phaeospora]
MAAPTKKTKHSKLDAVEINLGLQVLYPNPEDLLTSKSSNIISYDIVAIPGLGANPAYTWGHDEKNWLREMLPRRVPNARISAFEYQNQWFGKGAVDQRLENVADQLLYSLERSRGEGNKTPIIFVAHCLGGIVLERALITAQLRQNSFPSIFPFVAGSIFLGTPFRGTQTQAKAMILAEMAETIGLGMSSGLLQILKKDSDTLLRMLDEFVRLCNDAQIRNFCFFESQESDVAALLLKGLPFKRKELVVDKESATYPGVDNQQLASDHFHLNKFTSSKDGNFVSVSDEIRITTQKAAGIIKSRQKALQNALVDDRTYQALKEFLRKGFSDLDVVAKGSHRGPKSNEPSWIVEVKEYKVWKEEQKSNILWIHSKAGTGQGPIASSVIEGLAKTCEQGSVVASFFCDQGDEHRRSLEKMLKLLIRQVIDLNQDLAEHLLTDAKRGKSTGKQAFDEEYLSKISTLWDALQNMAKSLSEGFMYIIIYGLEQLSKESLTEFLRCIQDLAILNEDSQGMRIKWILFSRSGRPDIEKVLKPKAYKINIDDDENSDRVSKALRADISMRVDELGLSAPLSYFVKRHVHSRADYDYVYVSLAIQELKNERETGKATHSYIRALLESFPMGLTEMFEHIRRRVLDPKAEGIEYTKEILRCMILAKRDPTMRELAVMAGLPEEDRDNLEQLKDHIIRCGAFLTLRGNELDEDAKTVEWIDISAREHLEKYAKDDLALELRDMQDGIIALRCLSYIYDITERYQTAKVIEPTVEDVDETDEHQEGNKSQPYAVPEDESNSIEDHKLDATEEQHGEGDEDQHVEGDEDNASHAPSDEVLNDSQFDEDDALQYPVQYWIEHAKSASVDVIEEFRTDHVFWQAESRPRQDWWKVNESIHWFDDQADVSALHVATITGYSALVDRLLNQGWASEVHKEDSIGYQPLFYACSGGEYEIVQMLLGAGSDINFVSHEGKITALIGAADSGHREIVELLLDRDADIDATSEKWGTAVYCAADNNHLDVMRLLFARGADANVIGGESRRPLNVAAFNGSVEAVRLLLEHGADVDPNEEYLYGSAVGVAARRGHVDVVKLLISKGWSPSKPMKTYGSFLTAASTYGHVDVVELLVTKESRVTVLEQALQAASQNGKADAVKIILDHTPTLRHQKAFMLAAFYGRDEVLKLLFPRGISQEKLDEALYKACDNENEETTKLLLEFGANPDAEGAEYGCALTASAFDGTENILRALLEKGADANKRGGTYGTALQAAALDGDVDIVKLLLKHGAKVNTEPIGTYGTPLQAACYTGDEDTIRVLLEHHADINAYGGEYGYAIVAAVSESDTASIDILLEHNADVNVRGGNNNKPLIAIAGATLPKEYLAKILDHGAEINAVCNRGTTVLITCADALDTEGLEFLISRGADVHVISEEHGTALHAAAAQGDHESCEVLLKAGSDVNAVGGPHGTCLTAAALDGNIETVKQLLKAGADPTGVDLVAGEYGTPLQAACFGGDDDVVKELIEHGAVIDLPTGNGKFGYPLQAAAVAGHDDIIELLLEKGADPNLEGGLHGFALLAAASKNGQEHIVGTLVDHGARLSVEGGLLGSLVQAAAYGNIRHDALEALVEGGMDVHAAGGKYGSGLQAACFFADLDSVEVLLAKGVDVNYQGGKYGTALQASASRGRLEYVERLLKAGADVRIRGGKYQDAIQAAASRGHTSVLEKFLDMGLPEQILDEAFVAACAYRQSASVEALLKSGANVYARHPTFGVAMDTLRVEQADGYNSDDELYADPDEDEDEDDEEEDDDEDDDDEEDEFEGDDEESDGGDTDEGSVKDLHLEEEVTEEMKIQKLLDEAMARVKRNPSVTRYRTVKRRGLPQSLAAGPPQMPPMPSYQRYSQAMTADPYGQTVGQQQYHGQQPPPVHTYPGLNQRGSPQTQQGYPPPINNGYTPYNASASTPPPPRPHPQQYQSPISGEPPSHESPQRFQQYPQYSQPPPHPSQPQRPVMDGAPNATHTPPPLPARIVSQEQSPHRYSQSSSPGPQMNPGPGGRYQLAQRKPVPSSQPAYQQRPPPPPQQDSASFPAPNVHSPHPQAPYSAQPPQPQHNYPPPQPQYTSPPPPQQRYSQPPAQSPYQSSPASHHQAPPPQHRYSQAPPSQEAGYVAYGQASQASSQTSFQSSQYAQSTQYGGSQGYSPYNGGSPHSSQTSGFGGQTQGQGQGQGQNQGSRWNGGGYDGEGYG